MSVVISSSLVLSGAVSGAVSDFNGNNPIIGYQNLVTTSNITTTTADEDHPAVNLANPASHLYWRGILGSPAAANEFITVILNAEDDVDYVGIARHNFGSGVIIASVERQATGPGDSWVEIVGETILGDDSPVIFRFVPQSLYAVRVKLQPSQASSPVAPEAGVVYVGKLLILQRRIYVGHTPINYGRSTNVVTGKSESGNFLGRIILGESRSSEVKMQNLTPGWYRTYLDPFVVSAQQNPFFFAWRPLDYPLECGYAWLTDDPQPSNQLGNGMMQISFNMTGIA